MLPPILGTRKRVPLQITESPADARAKNKNQSDTGVFPKSWENDNEIYCH